MLVRTVCVHSSASVILVGDWILGCFSLLLTLSLLGRFSLLLTLGCSLTLGRFSLGAFGFSFESLLFYNALKFSGRYVHNQQHDEQQH